jgi:hypothetical protein
MDPALTTWADSLQFFNPETTAEMFSAEMLWFFGGVLCAFGLCAFGTVIRAVRAAGSNVDV